jgi:hypothetical protein
MRREATRHVLPDLGLSIERYTDSVPGDGAWYLIRAGETIGRFRTYKDARAAWDELVRESGYSPARREADPKAALLREASARWARNRAG